jgi:hypothetical protein
MFVPETEGRVGEGDSGEDRITKNPPKIKKPKNPVFILLVQTPFSGSNPPTYVEARKGKMPISQCTKSYRISSKNTVTNPTISFGDNKGNFNQNL